LNTETLDGRYVGKHDVLDHGHIILEKYMGNEIDVLANARVSFNDDVHAGSVEDLSEKDVGVLNFLMAKKHGTPWEAPVFRFDVKAPIFVFREWHRHRIASINEWSARYSQLDPEWYIPEPENIRSQVGSPGRYTFEPVEDPVVVETVRANLNAQNRGAFQLYENLLGQGIAKEVARTCLPVSTYSRMKWQTNLRSIFNFVALRSDPNAQWEIRQYSIAMEELLEQVVPLAMRLFNENGRVSP